MRIHPIGRVEDGFPEKFGTPRQPGLAPSARARVVLQPPYDDPAALEGLSGFSHVWLLFGFHLAAVREWRPTVRPPRLGGNRRVGVFASRSPFRPSGLGQSVVALEAVRSSPWRGLVIADHDLVTGTPVYDIRPYLPYSDALPDATTPAPFSAAPARLGVRFEAAARDALAALSADRQALIAEVLAADPRPAYRRRDDRRRYGVRVAGCNVRWRVEDEDCAVVESVQPES